MRVVLDTDVVAAAARSDRGASFQWLLAALEHRVRLLLSVSLCLESRPYSPGQSISKQRPPPRRI
jgi:predicted nucleic acid-binding protein